MAYGDAVVFVASSARTVTANGTAQSAEKATFLNLLVDVTASSGTTPTLDLTVEWSMDGTNFGAAQAADSFTQFTATGRAFKQFSIKAPFYRLVWTIGGTTPSFTFSAARYTTG